MVNGIENVFLSRRSCGSLGCSLDTFLVRY